MTTSAIVCRSKGLVYAAIDNKVVAVSIADAACYGLNLVGSRIWNLIATSTYLRDLCAKLITKYKADSAVCEQQVLDLLEEPHAEGLIVTSEDNI
jgi:hypothetical protein